MAGCEKARASRTGDMEPGPGRNLAGKPGKINWDILNFDPAVCPANNSRAKSAHGI